MNLREMSTINLMKSNVANADAESIWALCEEMPLLVQYSEGAPREIRLEMLQVAASIIDKLQELVPEVTKEEGWASYAEMRSKLGTLIMETRFAVR